MAFACQRGVSGNAQRRCACEAQERRSGAHHAESEHRVVGSGAAGAPALRLAAEHSTVGSAILLPGGDVIVILLPAGGDAAHDVILVTADDDVTLLPSGHGQQLFVAQAEAETAEGGACAGNFWRE